MRPLRLVLKGFTAFREETAVDFEGRRLFAITGATGAGKSSLLDAITWALYGQVPRVGSSTRQLVSHGASAMSVRFEFSTRGRRYRVSRRAPGTVATRLEREDEGGEWVPLADRARDVTEQVTKVLGLDYQTFTQTVLLPQGEFDSFLKGDQRERREILSRLLGLGLYAEVRGIAGRREATARTRAVTLATQLARVEVATTEALAALEARRVELEARQVALAERRERLATLAESARADRDAGRASGEAERTARAAAEALWQAAARLEASRARIAQSTNELDSARAQRERLGYDADAHRALEQRVALIALREEAERDAAAAREAAGAAERELADARAAVAEGSRAEQASAKREASAARALEREEAALASATGRALRAAERLEREAAEADAEVRAAEQAAAERTEQARQLEAICAQVEELKEELIRACTEAERARALVKSTKAASAGAVKARDRAEGAVAQRREALEALRVRNAAARIQRTLRAGDRCPVCGETVRELVEEPAPNLDAAGAAVREAERVLQQARAAAEHRATDAAAAEARLEGAHRALDQLERRRADFDARLGFAAEEGLTEAMGAAARAVMVAVGRAEAARVVAAGRRDEAAALRLALARVPLEVAPAGEARGAAVTPEALGVAVDAHAGARRARATEAEAARERARERAEAERIVEGAQRGAAQAAAARADAERRLAARAAGAEGDARAVRKALATVEEAAGGARRLDESIARLGAERAAAEAQREAREGEHARASAEAQARAAGLAAAQDEAAAARAAFEAAWREGVGEGVPGIEPLRAIMIEHDAAERTALQELGAAGERLKHARGTVAEAQRMREEVAAFERAAALAAALEQELRGNRFIAYVQQEAMQLLAADASHHIAQFTSGRYELVAEKDEFLVVDRLNGDERRSVKTLSGGETFLASLALSLSLSEHLPQLSGTGGAIALESLFLDEGFGSLDAESLDLAVQGLETLAGGQRVIGVISHIEELSERLPDRIEVVKQGNSSTVRVR